MRIVARQARTSTCPLCRAAVIRAHGVTCATCGACSHSDCVRELGGCHGRGALATRASLAARRQATELLDTAQTASTDDDQPLTRAQKIGLWTGGLILLCAAIAALIQSGARGALMTGFWGLLGPVTLLQVWEGLTTGRVKTTAKHSDEVYSFSEQPLRFLFHLILWLAMGVGFTVAAAAPFFASGW